MDYPNSPGGGKRGCSPSRKSTKKTPDEDEDCNSSWVVKSSPNCLAFVSCPTNYGEEPQIKVLSLNHPPANSSTSCSDRSGSPPPKRSPGKLKCLALRENKSEKPERGSKKWRARENNASSTVQALCLG